ncbi:MAG: BlaI/MecI/CopY family transcriptional regulator [Chitinophagaceae bacterium]|nr:MAG: BlaI/MecI/CopY family transcriptional regulator [Chitinophagaceae bacterium]
MELSKSEEQLMEFIWRQEGIFLKDLLNELPEPKPASTTVATLLKRMQDKGFVTYETFGNSRKYFAAVQKDHYFSKQVNGIIRDYFDNSALQFASFFTNSTNLTAKELESLKDLIDKQIKKKKK